MEMAKEFFMKNEKVFCNRGTSIAMEVLCYDYAMFTFAFAPYGPYWRQLRKTATLELLYTQGFEMLKKFVETEVCQSIEEVSEKSASGNVKVDLKKWFGDVTLNVIMKMIVGKSRFSEEGEDHERYRRALREFSELIETLTPADGLLFLRWMDLDGYEKKMKWAADELDGELQGWLDEHKRRETRKTHMVSETSWT